MIFIGPSMKNYELRGEKTKKVYDSIKSVGSITLKETAEKTGVNYNTVRGAVQKASKDGFSKAC